MDTLNDTGEKFDLEKTQIINELLLVDRENRDENWLAAFRENIWHASMQNLEPQVIVGPDRFPYFNLVVPTAGKEFQTYSLSHVAEYCINNGYGVVVFASEEEFSNANPEFAIPLGTLDSLVRHKSWAGIYNPDVNAAPGIKKEQIEKDRKVMVGAPSEDVIPMRTRHFLGQVMRKFGIQNPKIGLVVEPESGHNLLVNCRPADFPGNDEIDYFCHVMSWYMTPGIGIIFMPDGWKVDNLVAI